MSVLVVGLSYRSAPLALLERAALPAERARALEARLCRCDHVAEAVVLSTCNRLEVYADVSKFHSGVSDVGRLLAVEAGVRLDELTDHLYIHYEDAAVAHLFSVACGLDSMAVGEQQILGQVREVLRAAQYAGSAGRVLDGLLQHALRVGKRAHTETDLDRAGHSLVEEGLTQAEKILGPLDEACVLVVGAGAMSGLAVATAQRHGVGSITVANRTPGKAERLAASVGATAAGMDALPGALAGADIVVSSTGAVGYVLGEALVARALTARQAVRDGVQQVYVDLALPRDVAPGVAMLPGAHVFGLEELGHALAGEGLGTDLEAVRELVADEVAGYLAGRRAQEVAPTVIALRAHARGVVEAELARLSTRLPDLDEKSRAEVAQAVHRVVEKLLHTPTVRVKELANQPEGGQYAAALRELFDLPRDRLEDVTNLDSGLKPQRVGLGVDRALERTFDGSLGQVGGAL